MKEVSANKTRLLSFYFLNYDMKQENEFKKRENDCKKKDHSIPDLLDLNTTEVRVWNGMVKFKKIIYVLFQYGNPETTHVFGDLKSAKTIAAYSAPSCNLSVYRQVGSGGKYVLLTTGPWNCF